MEHATNKGSLLSGGQDTKSFNDIGNVLELTSTTKQAMRIFYTKSLENIHVIIHKKIQHLESLDQTSPLLKKLTKSSTLSPVITQSSSTTNATSQSQQDLLLEIIDKILNDVHNYNGDEFYQNWRENPSKYLLPLRFCCDVDHVPVSVISIALDCFQKFISYGFIWRNPNSNDDLVDPITSADVETISPFNLLRILEQQNLDTEEMRKKFIIDQIILNTCNCFSEKNDFKTLYMDIVRTISVALSFIFELLDWHYLLCLRTCHSILVTLQKSDEQIDSQVRSDVICTLVQLFSRIFSNLEVWSAYSYSEFDDNNENDSLSSMTVISRYLSLSKTGRSISCNYISPIFELPLEDLPNESSSGNMLISPYIGANILNSSSINVTNIKSVDHRTQSIDLSTDDFGGVRTSTMTSSAMQFNKEDKSLFSYFLPKQKKETSHGEISPSLMRQAIHLLRPSKEFGGIRSTCTVPFTFQLLPRNLVKKLGMLDEERCRYEALAVVHKLCNIATKTVSKEDLPFESDDINWRTTSLQMLYAILTCIGQNSINNHHFLLEIAEPLFNTILSNCTMMDLIPFELGIKLFEITLGRFEFIWRLELTEILADGLLPIMENNNSTYHQKISILRFLQRFLANEPAMDLYRRFAGGRDNLLIKITHSLCRMAARSHQETNWINSKQDNLIKCLSADLALQIIQSVCQSLQMEAEKLMRSEESENEIMRRRLSKWRTSQPEKGEQVTKLEVDEVALSYMPISKRKRKLFALEAEKIAATVRAVLSKIYHEKDGNIMATMSSDIWDDEELEQTTVIRTEEDDDNLDAAIDMFERIYCSALEVINSIVKTSHEKIIERTRNSNYSILKVMELIASTSVRIQDSIAFGQIISCIVGNTGLMNDNNNFIQSEEQLMRPNTTSNSQFDNARSSPISASSSFLLASLSSLLTRGNSVANVQASDEKATQAGISNQKRFPSFRISSRNLECTKLMLRLVHNSGTLLLADAWADVMRCIIFMETLPEEMKVELLSLQASLDTVFVKSTALPSMQFYNFIQGLCRASLSNIYNGANKRYGMDKLLEVTFFNMNRSSLDRIEMWKRVGAHLVDALFILIEKNEEPNIVTWIMDTLRQLIETFLEQNQSQDESEVQSGFACNVLMPFYEIIDRSSNQPLLRDRIIMNCLGPIVMKRCRIVKSGWRCILRCIGRITEFDEPSSTDMIEYLFDEYLSIMMVRPDYFSMIVSYGCFVDLVECLARFAICPHAKQIAVYAIEFIAMCAQNLAMGKVYNLAHSDEEHIIITQLWQSLCVSMCRIICYADRVEIRHNAIDQMTTVIRIHCIAINNHYFWEKLFASTLLPAIKDAIERECQTSTIEREYAPSPASPEAKVRSMTWFDQTNLSDIKRRAALVTEWVAMTLPHLMGGVLNVICDIYQQGILKCESEQCLNLFGELVDTIRSFFVHEQKCHGELERCVVFNAKLAEIGHDMLFQLLRRAGSIMSVSQWALLRDMLRDLFLVDTNAPSHVSHDRFVYDEDVFDVESKVHLTLVQIIQQIVFSFCGKGGHRTLTIRPFNLDDALMFLEVIWSSYRGAQELHQKLLTAQLHTQRITRQYGRMVHLRPRLIRHEAMTLTSYLEILFRMLNSTESPAICTAAKDLLMPLSRDLIDAYLASQGDDISPPSATQIFGQNNKEHRHDEDNKDETLEQRFQDLRGSFSRELIRASSPVSEPITRKRSTSQHEKQQQQQPIKLAVDIPRTGRRRTSIHIESPSLSTNRMNSGILFLKEHMDHDSKMTAEMVNVLAIVLNGFLKADRLIFDTFVESMYDSLSNLILSDTRTIREPLHSIFTRKRRKDDVK